jgi:hypothetical protein
MFTAISLLPLMLLVQAAPVERVWIRSRLNVRAIAPDVQDVRIEKDYVEIVSAGLSLQSFGPLQAAPLDPNGGVRRFDFRIPRRPIPGPSPTPPGITGVFVNGVPIYNPAGALSYQDQDIWHVDAVAMAADSTRTGHRVDIPPLLQSILDRKAQHSPIIGFALDGYPIYGPYSGDGRRFTSSYHLRKIKDRRTLPGGLELPPAQEGPPLSGDFPLGTFAEDYECTPGSGDLDCHNGRFAITPEYPQGTYAYFLSTTPNGGLAFPYLIGSTFAGTYEPTLPALTRMGTQSGLTLRASTPSPKTGQSVTWLFQADTPSIEKVHEKPMHLIVVSCDQSFFDHVHPQLITSNRLTLQYTFTQPGRYWLYADFTPAGGTQTIARFPIDVSGDATAPVPIARANAPKLTIDGPLESGRDLTFHFDLTDHPNLDRYLGAWAHLIVMSADGEEFIHAHPKEDLPAAPSSPWVHVHDAAAISPDRIETTTGFRRAGNYKIWIQIQKAGEVQTYSYNVAVAGADSRAITETMPPGAQRIDVDGRGFTPARISLPAGRTARLVFYRANAQNCASRIVFPALKIEKDLRPNAATIVEIPAQPGGTISFNCGMGMFRGALVITQSP